MPTYPTPEGRRCITLELPTELVQYLDAQASYFGCSRAAYLRQLIVRDQERQSASAVG
jgi:predicted DNA-binding protein